GVIEPWGVGLFCRAVSRWIALFYFLSYGLWFYWGAGSARSLFGRAPDQGGFLWLATMEDKTEPFSPSWKTKKGDKE
ncbi:MAG: hypothetical protein ABIH66_01665, partial [bacterium]